ncbi:MAG: hypothetical protein ACTS3F_05970 [Phycisphaerales bacterium]
MTTTPTTTTASARAAAAIILLAAAAASSPALAGGFSYTLVEQSVGGSATVSDDGGFETDSFWLSESPDPVDLSQSFAFAVDNGIPLAEIAMEGGIESSFTPSSFSVFAESNYSLASTTIWGGLFVNGTINGDASAAVWFEIASPTLVEYSLNASNFASFERVLGGGSFEFIDGVFFPAPGAPPITAQILLEPGAYLMWGGEPFKDNDNPGFFTGSPNNFVDLQLTIIPAPGAAAPLALAALAAASRRRR